MRRSSRGLTDAEMARRVEENACLSAVRAFPGSTKDEIAMRTNLSPDAARRALARLEKRGAVSAQEGVRQQAAWVEAKR